jgi:hypothetical protein
VERLMLLDAVLASPGLTWLTSEREKASYVTRLSAPVPTEHPDASVAVSPPRTVGAFRSTFPIGLDPSGRAVLLYLVTAPWTDEFRTFLQDHAACLRVASSWALRLAFPRPLDRAYGAYQTVVREELETPLHSATIGELKWYFEHRQQAIGHGVNVQTQAFLERAAQVFNTPRFTRLYRRWLKQGDAAFEAVSSPVIAETLASGAGRVECLALPHTYRHLSPLANLVRSAAPPSTAASTATAHPTASARSPVSQPS